MSRSVMIAGISAASTLAVVAWYRRYWRRRFGILESNPRTMGMNSKSLAGISSWMRNYVDSGKLPHAIVAVVRDGRVVFADHYGYKDVAAKQTVAEDTIVRIFSMSKPITAVAAMILMERGMLRIDDPVSKFIPAFASCTVYVSGDAANVRTERPKREVTIRDLLTHTSGIGYGEAVPGGVGEASKTCTELWLEHGLDSCEGCSPSKVGAKTFVSLADWAAAVASVPLMFEPGSAWFYGYNIDVVGAVIEIIAGVPLGQFLQQEIFEPLRMVDTGFVVPVDKKERLARIYEPCESDCGAHKLRETVGYPDADAGKMPTIPLGGAGLFSTARDYLRFAHMLLNGGELEGHRILGSRTVRFMSANHLPGNSRLVDLDKGCGYSEADINGMAYCLGMSLVTSPEEFGVNCSVGEIGWGGWASTWFAVDPKERIVALLLTQLAPSTTYPLRTELRNLIYGSINW